MTKYIRSKEEDYYDGFGISRELVNVLNGKTYTQTSIAMASRCSRKWFDYERLYRESSGRYE